MIKDYPQVFDNLKIVGNLWKIPFKMNKKNSYKKTLKSKKGHSGYPPKLCEVVIKMFSNENDNILDCFAGNFLLGTIGKDLNRNMFGIDINKYE